MYKKSRDYRVKGVNPIYKTDRTNGTGKMSPPLTRNISSPLEDPSLTQPSLSKLLLLVVLESGKKRLTPVVSGGPKSNGNLCSKKFFLL